MGKQQHKRMLEVVFRVIQEGTYGFNKLASGSTVRSHNKV